MTLDQEVIERSNYTILDVLSDVGGLESVIASAIALILSILNYNNLDSTMITQLFTFPADSTSSADNHEKRTVTYKASLLGNFADYLLDFLPGCCRCCKLTRRQKQYEVAVKRLYQETDMIYLIRQVRYLTAALEHVTMTTAQRDDIIKKTKLAHLNLDDDLQDQILQTKTDLNLQAEHLELSDY